MKKLTILTSLSAIAPIIGVVSCNVYKLTDANFIHLKVSLTFNKSTKTIGGLTTKSFNRRYIHKIELEFGFYTLIIKDIDNKVIKYYVDSSDNKIIKDVFFSRYYTTNLR